MFRMHRRHRQRPISKPILPITASPNDSTTPPAIKSRHDKRRLTWINLALGALIPLMLGIGTVVITVRQQKLDDRRQEQERELDDRRYKLELDQANELHYQDVFKTYIADISNTIFKLQQQPHLNQMTFVDNRTRLAYIRSQTLTALADLDSQRRTRLFLFLHENKLLPRISSPIEKNDTDLSLDLSGANLVHITLKNSPHNKFQFHRLSLPSADLSNASFIGCTFMNGISFSVSAMSDAKFTGSTFQCKKDYVEDIELLGSIPIFFHQTLLTRADFRGTYLCDINFNESDLAYANFSRAWFTGKTEMSGANLAFSDFSDVKLADSFSMVMTNANMTSASILDNSYFKEALNKGQLQIMNVILPNGTWLINDTNLIQNGNAEINCSLSLDENELISGWDSVNLRFEEYPTISINQNSVDTSLGKCYFNFTAIDKEVDICQLIFLTEFSFFIDSSEAEYYLTVDISCIGGALSMNISFYNEDADLLSYTIFFVNGTNDLQWLTQTNEGKIPTTTHSLIIGLGRAGHPGLCYVDNTELYIRRGKITKY